MEWKSLMPSMWDYPSPSRLTWLTKAAGLKPYKHAYDLALRDSHGGNLHIHCCKFGGNPRSETMAEFNPTPE